MALRLIHSLRQSSSKFQRFSQLMLAGGFAALLSLTGCGSTGTANPGNPSVGNPGTPSAQGTQILYVSHAQTVGTFTVDPQTGTVQPAGPDVVVASNPSSSEGTVTSVTSPNGHALYVSWNDAAGAAHISVFATDAHGVPQQPPLQTLDMPGQLAIHPSGRFAYLVQSKSVMEVASATLRVLSVDPATGKLSDTGMSGSDPQYPFGDVSLYAVSRDGSVLYTQGITSFDGEASLDYIRHSIDSNTGSLGQAAVFFSHGWNWGDLNVSAVGARYTANLFDAFDERIPQVTFIDVQSLQDPTMSIHCTSAMLDACLSAGDVRFDPSGDFLLVTDVVTNRLRVLHVDASAKVLRDTGSAIPISIPNPQLWFSPDTSLLYAVLGADATVHIFRFDSTSGSLTAIGQALTFSIPFQLTPAQLQ